MPFCWIPLTAAKRREHKDPILWRTWERSGLVRIVAGDVLDHDQIADEIKQLCEPYKVQEIAVDRAYANQGALRLRDQYGFNVSFYSHSLMNVCGPTAALENAILLKRIAHDGNPVLRWQVSNARTTLPDKNANVQLSKGKSADKIDMVCAMLMAADKAGLGTAPLKTSIYNTRGALWF